MKHQMLVVAVPLVLAACASPLPEGLATAGNPEIATGISPIQYSNPAGDYNRRMPVDPKPWRGLNDAQRPKGGE